MDFSKLNKATLIEAGITAVAVGLFVYFFVRKDVDTAVKIAAVAFGADALLSVFALGQMVESNSMLPGGSNAVASGTGQ